MRLVAPKDLYFLSVIAFIKIVALSPSRRLRELAIGTLAAAAYRFSRTKRQRSEKNLSRAFAGTLNQEQKQRIIKGAFVRFWQEMCDWLPSHTASAAIQGAETHGVEQLRSALKREKGAILWESNGFGSRILAKRILHENGFSLHQIHGANDLGGFLHDVSGTTWLRERVIKHFFKQREKLFVTETIRLPHSNSLEFTRLLVTLLNRNAILCVSGDGKDGQKLIRVEFLAVPTPFASGMVSLARLSGAPILPMFCIQRSDGVITLTIADPIHMDRAAGRERALEKSLKEYASLLEAQVRRYPALYRNWHTLGEGVDDEAGSERD